MDVSLVMVKADGTQRDFPISKGRVVLGRANSCDLRIPLSSVSRQHCEIVVAPESILLRDLGSSNGTFHNDARVTEAQLKPGDEILVGSVLFRLQIDGKPSLESVAAVDPDASHAEEQASAASDHSATLILPEDDADAEDEGDGDDSIFDAMMDEAVEDSGQDDDGMVDLDDPISAIQREDDQAKGKPKAS